jgi:hypothetical protein
MNAIYLVKTPSEQRLIRAGSKSVAINYAVKSMIEAKSVSAAELADLLDEGLTIEDAGKRAPSTPADKEEAGEIEPEIVAGEQSAA